MILVLVYELRLSSFHDIRQVTAGQNAWCPVQHYFLKISSKEGRTEWELLEPKLSLLCALCFAPNNAVL